MRRRRRECERRRIYEQALHSFIPTDPGVGRRWARGVVVTCVRSMTMIPVRPMIG